MIENTLWMTYFEYLPIELKQAEEEGKNVELYRKEIEEIIQTSGDMSFEEKERKRHIKSVADTLPAVLRN